VAQQPAPPPPFSEPVVALPCAVATIPANNQPFHPPIGSIIEVSAKRLEQFAPSSDFVCVSDAITVAFLQEKLRSTSLAGRTGVLFSRTSAVKYFLPK
jgi:hypothetical protein